jgi:hypothetical protein
MPRAVVPKVCMYAIGIVNGAASPAKIHDVGSILDTSFLGLTNRPELDYERASIRAQVFASSSVVGCEKVWSNFSVESDIDVLLHGVVPLLVASQLHKKRRERVHPH